MNLPRSLGVIELANQRKKAYSIRSPAQRNAPKGALTPEVTERIREHKAGLLAHLSARSRAEEPIPRVSREGSLPLGFVQQRMWLHNLMQPETVLYSLPAAWRLRGTLDRSALGGALRDVAERHEVMRCRIEEPADPVQHFRVVTGAQHDADNDDHVRTHQ